MNKREESRTFVIERDIRDVGDLSQVELRDVARKSCSVLDELGPSIQWLHSYVTDDRVYCIYSAPDEGLIRRHAEMGGFPANRISRVHSVIDPSTAQE